MKKFFATAFMIGLSTTPISPSFADTQLAWKESVVPAIPRKPIKPMSVAQRLLHTHNIERAKLKLPPLVWDEQLAKSAAKWATEMSKLGDLVHDTQKEEGENLWSGTKGAYQPEEMVEAWIDEKKDFVPGKFPNVTRTANWEDVGHYTQLIWKNTKRVGCAIAPAGEIEVLVCRYFPAGNWDGESVGK